MDECYILSDLSQLFPKVFIVMLVTKHQNNFSNVCLLMPEIFFSLGIHVGISVIKLNILNPPNAPPPKKKRK